MYKAVRYPAWLAIATATFPIKKNVHVRSMKY